MNHLFWSRKKHSLYHTICKYFNWPCIQYSQSLFLQIFEIIKNRKITIVSCLIIYDARMLALGSRSTGGDKHYFEREVTLKSLSSNTKRRLRVPLFSRSIVKQAHSSCKDKYTQLATKARINYLCYCIKKKKNLDTNLPPFNDTTYEIFPIQVICAAPATRKTCRSTARNKYIKTHKKLKKHAQNSDRSIICSPRKRIYA